MNLAHRWRLTEDVRFYLLILLIDSLLVVAAFAWAGLIRDHLPSIGLPLILGAFLAGAFLVRPKETLTAFVLYVLFYETIALWTTSSVKHVDEVTVPIFFLISLVRRDPLRRSMVDPVREGALAIAAAMAVASSLAAGVSLDIMIPGLLLLVKGALLFYIALWEHFEVADVRRIVRVVGTVGVIVLGLGFVELVNPSGFQEVLHLRLEEQVRGGITSIKSVFFHPVLFGWFTAFVGLFFFSYYSVFRRWWQLALALAFTAGSILSGRRKAIVGAGVALLAGATSQLFVSRNVRQFLRVWLPAAAGVAVIVLLFLPYFKDLSSNAVGHYLPPSGGPVASTAPAPSGSHTQTPTYTFAKGTPPRVALYLVSVDVARDYFPLGAGLGRYGSYLSAVHFSPLYARYGLTSIPGLRPTNSSAVTDTFWPQILGELGVFGLIAYAVFIGSLLWGALRSAWTFQDQVLRAFTLGALLVLVEALVESVAAPMFAAPSATYLVLGAVGISLSLRRSAIPRAGDS